MILRTLIWSLVLFVAYNVALLVPAFTKYSTVQSLRQDGIVRTEEFLFGSRKPTHVIVGTSLARRLDARVLGPDFANLALSGGSPLTGLEIIRLSSRRPPLILIELNNLHRGLDPVLVHDSFPPFGVDVQIFPAVLDRNQPANLIIGRAGDRMLRDALPLIGVPTLAPDQNVGVVDQALFEQLRETKADDFIKLVTQRRMDEQFDRLSGLIAALEKDGSKCAFLEMPIDPSLQHLPRMEQMRAAVEARFPRERYPWITAPAGESYATTDGTHLVMEDAAHFAAQIRSAVEALPETHERIGLRH